MVLLVKYLNLTSKVLLEEFENVPAVIEPTDRSLLSSGEICDTIILSFNGEILERVKQIDGVYEGGYLTNLNGKFPWYNAYRLLPCKPR